LDAIERQDPSAIDRDIDWAVKWSLIERYRSAHGLPLSDLRVARLDLAYHDIRCGRGVFDLLQRKGLVQRVTDDVQIEVAQDIPPQTTRAKLRGEFIAAAEQAGQPFTADWMHLRLNDQPRHAVVCQDPFSAVDRPVEQLIASLRSGRRHRGRTPA
jgi:proteasome accessory factor A